MIWRYLLCAIAAYLLGSFSTGILVSRQKGTNIRERGSHNTGASNVLRVLGVKDGAVTFAGDFAKAALGVLIGRWLAGQNGAMVAGLFAVIGHNWPCFFSFKGGKGIACSTAVLLLTFWWQGAAAIAACVLVIGLTRYISLGSLTMLTVFSLLLLFTEGFFPAFVWALALAALAFWRHRSNIGRLLNGTENKLSFHKSKPAGHSKNAAQ